MKPRLKEKSSECWSFCCPNSNFWRFCSLTWKIWVYVSTLSRKCYVNKIWFTLPFSRVKTEGPPIGGAVRNAAFVVLKQRLSWNKTLESPFQNCHKFQNLRSDYWQTATWTCVRTYIDIHTFTRFALDRKQLVTSFHNSSWNVNTVESYKVVNIEVDSFSSFHERWTRPFM